MMQAMANISSILFVPPQPPPTSKLEEFLRKKEIDSGDLLRRSCNNISLNFENKIDALCHCNRLNADYDILEYWENKKFADPELYLLAQTVLGVPTSRVSVKRAFSALSLVLTHSRTPLNGTTLNNILIIQLNEELFNSIQL